MNILHIIYDDPKNQWVGGGGAIRTQKINEILAKKHNITVITGAFPNCKREEIINNVKYIRIGFKNNYFLSRLCFSMQVKNIISKYKKDILIEEISGNSLTNSPKYTDKPCIGIVQNYFGINIIKKRLLLGVFSYLYEKKALKKLFTNFILVSPALENIVSNHNSRANIAVIPQGIDKVHLNKEPNIKEEFLLFVGRLDYFQKGLDILLKSFARIEEKDLKLLIVGGGNSRKLFSMIDNLNLKGRVIYEGQIDHKKLEYYYQSCMFLCLPSRYEGWPLVCLESYAFKKTVLGTDIPGLRGVVKNNETGILVKPNSVDEYFNKMKLLINDKKLRRQLGKAAYYFAKEFTWENIAQKQLGFYKEVLEKK